MPYVRNAYAEETYTELVDALAAELQCPAQHGQPMIIEDATPSTKSIRVQVIWDRWESCPPAVRFDLIRRAYEAAFGAEKASQITLATGVTFGEALNLGFLPYEVRLLHGITKQANADEYRAAMLQAGGVEVEGESNPRLFFPTLELAEKAVDQLQNAIPKARLVIREAVSSN